MKLLWNYLKQLLKLLLFWDIEPKSLGELFCETSCTQNIYQKMKIKIYLLLFCKMDDRELKEINNKNHKYHCLNDVNNINDVDLENVILDDQP